MSEQDELRAELEGLDEDLFDFPDVVGMHAMLTASREEALLPPGEAPPPAPPAPAAEAPAESAGDSVSAADVLADGVSYVSDDCGAGPPAGSTWTWTTPVLPAFGLVACNLTVEVVELGLKVRADILNGLIVNSRPQRVQHQIEHLFRPERGKRFIKLAREKRLQLTNETFSSILCQSDVFHSLPSGLRCRVSPGS